MQYMLDWILVLLILLPVFATADPTRDHRIDTIPQGYHLYTYDDCGVLGRQPHVDMADCYAWTFGTNDNDADLKSRSAVFSYKEIRLNYNDLDPKLSYVLALTYASDHIYKRVRSLEADGVELHGPIALPNAKAIRVIVRVPESVTQDGKMQLRLKIHGEVNATISIAELWASAPPPASLRLESISALPDGMTGRITDLAYNGLDGAAIRLVRPSDHKTLAVTTTRTSGDFSFARSSFDKLPREDLEIMANYQGREAGRKIPADDQFFDPVHYRPIPAEMEGLARNTLSLDGTWRINPSPDERVKETPLNSAAWSNFKVPGQWLQQGFDIPQDKPVAVAREFTIPKEWADYRIFLRFDAIHAGTHYWLNGKPLGYSENLFTPVEWEITDFVRIGEVNRLDLKMVVATPSERLSCSSAYAQHSLGGIDRAVTLYALPTTHISSLRVDAGLDAKYQDGELSLDVTLSGSSDGYELVTHLYDPSGKSIEHSNPNVEFEQGAAQAHVSSRVTNPLKWSAEKPRLYKLIIELMEHGKSIERIERNVGFRTIEVKNHQIYVNGVRVKLAGVCRHEIDPLTGRADTMRHAGEDIKLFKSGNLNYIRTSHYPPTQEFLDAADRLGMYVEVEAPFCWVAETDRLADIKEIMTPTSAMVDYCHSHPSVIIWSVANESAFNPAFEESDKLIRMLDPTRPTTFNSITLGARKIGDIANLHYPGMPYDELFMDDQRPLILGECFFEVYHERTDVAINPGLRELWCHGNADPNSEWGRACAESFTKPTLHPGIHPGAWEHLYDSERFIGGVIWSGVDDISFMPGGKIASSENGNAYWGLIDGWRRPKPELWYSKLIFAPVWFPNRHIDYKLGQTAVRIPIENRYSFTDLSELSFIWEMNRKKGRIKTDLPPSSRGEIEIPVPKGTPEGSKLVIKAEKPDGELINAAVLYLGNEKQAPLPQPHSGAPEWSDNGGTITIRGNGFSLVLDKKTGDFDAASPDHKAPIISFPALHVTRHDFNDLSHQAPPYALLPDRKTRVIEEIKAAEQPGGLNITIKDRYEHFEGFVSWLIDKDGTGKLSYNYTYMGPDLDTREIGLMALLKPQYDEVEWKRWSEWGVFPQDHISRTEGSARAHRDPKWPQQPANVKPAWPWSLDETDLGTNDFRSIKFNIYEASLITPDGSRVSVYANADVHFRSCLAPGGVAMHILSQCPLGQVVLKKSDRFTGAYSVRLAAEKE